MVIQSRTIFGAAAAFALVGAAFWASAVLFAPPAESERTGSVEVVQMQERSWTVEVKDLGAIDAPAEAARTAANR
ncbi:MAG: hypothetical protein ACREUC_18590 [Steroidobacteraceae bacterium]